MTFQQARMWRSELREKEIASAERALKSAQTQAMLEPQALVVAKKRTEEAEKRAAAEEKYKAAIESWMSAYEKMYRFRETPEEIIETTTDEASRIMRGLRGVEGGGLGDVIRGQRQAAIDALTDEDILTGDATMDRHMEWQKGMARITREINDELRADEKAAWDDFYANFSELGGQIFSSALGATQDYFDAVITGQENAEALLVASLMRTAGEALVGHGIDLAGRAVVSAFTPGMQPLAAAQGGAAAALIAGGVALGAGATSVEHIAAGGTIGQALPDDKATKDRGASPRRMGGGGDSGPLVVNVSYGAGGPLPEDIAREINRVVSSGNRRRGAA